MPSDIWTTSWSETDASNSQTPPEGWPAGMFPNAVEPAARMNMGAAKRFWNRINPIYAAQWNTADSYVVSPSVAPAGYGLRERWRLRFTAANVSTSPSVNISSLGAQLVQKYDGAGNLVNPAAGDIQAQDHEMWWNGSQFVLQNPAVQAIPSGAVIPYAGSSAPGGWLLCYGQAISRTGYSALFAAIGTTYGTGDGSTTFNLPDFRGRVAAGVDNMGGSAASRITSGNSGITGTTLGAAGGDERLHQHTHTATVTDPQHSHTSAWGNVNSTGALPYVASSSAGTQQNIATTSVSTGVTVANANTGSGSSQNVQPTIIVNYIIKT